MKMFSKEFHKQTNYAVKFCKEDGFCLILQLDKLNPGKWNFSKVGPFFPVLCTSSTNLFG